MSLFSVQPQPVDNRGQQKLTKEILAEPKPTFRSPPVPMPVLYQQRLVNFGIQMQHKQTKGENGAQTRVVRTAQSEETL